MSFTFTPDPPSPRQNRQKPKPEREPTNRGRSLTLDELVAANVAHINQKFPRAKRGDVLRLN
jgi:hypothetical protein